MQRLKSFVVNNPYFFLLLISIVTRFVWLKFGMPSLTDDEVDIYTSAYILARNGRDFFGNAFFLTSGILTPKPSIPIYIGTIPWLFTGIKTLFLARLPFAILNSFTPVLLFYITNKAVKNKTFSLCAFLIFNFSPWFSYISSTGYEATVALFFVLLFFALILSDIRTNIKIVLSSITSFLAFNSYMGIKPVFPFILIIAGLLFAVKQGQKMSLKKYLLIAFFSISLFGIFITANYIAPNSSLIKKEYGQMVDYYQKEQIEGLVWFERYTTTGPKLLTTLIANKYTIRLRDYASKYILSFNPQIFFQKGDPSSLYGTADLSGLFFLTDFVFFVIGLLSLHHVKQRGLKILIAVIFIGGISVAVSTGSPTFILRGILLILPYTLLITHGIMQILPKIYDKKIGYVLFALLLAFNYILFFITFQMRIINMNSEQWRYGYKKIDERLAQLKINYQNITVYTPQRREFFFQYAFYHMHDADSIKKHIEKEDYSVDNMLILNDCPIRLPHQNELVVLNSEFCKIDPESPLITVVEKIPSMDRSGKDYYIFSGSGSVENEVGDSK